MEILKPPTAQPPASPWSPAPASRVDICIGLASRGFPLHRHPGTNPYDGGGTGPVPIPPSLSGGGPSPLGVCASYGYRGTDGKVQAHVSHHPLLLLPCPLKNGNGPSAIALSVRGKEYGPGFAPGDVVGCGVDLVAQEVSQ